jgi:ABC-type polysaccharide/polyol phosphate export permease
MAALENSISQSLRIQCRVIHALFLREVLTRYGRHNIGFLWLFVEPMIFTLGVVTLWSMASGEHLSRLPIVAFAVTGYSSVLLWRNMPGRCAGAIEPNLSLMYHRNVKIIDIFISRILLEFMGTTMSFTILLLVFNTIGWMSPPEDILKIMLGWFMLAWLAP